MPRIRSSNYPRDGRAFNADYTRSSSCANFTEKKALKKEKSFYNVANGFESDELIEEKLRQQRVYEKLSVVRLSPISVGPSSPSPCQVFSVTQKFTFPASNHPSTTEISTQTMNLIENRIKTPHPLSLVKGFTDDRNSRPSSPSPPPLPAFTSDQHFSAPRVTADVRPPLPPKFDYSGTGDGVEKLSEFNGFSFDDFEPLPEHLERLLLKENDSDATVASRPSTATFVCRKNFLRPRTGQRKEKGASTGSTEGSKKPKKSLLHRKPSQKAQTSSDSSVSTSSGCYQQKLAKVVDQLQDPNWEVCHEGLKNFAAIANSIFWGSEASARHIPFISRKLIECFRSPRSNLCRTACQVAGSFFELTRTTKRPEFDEMVDILLCKTADSSRFIQLDANVALDKMAASVPIMHSIRAICAKAPANKSPLVRAAAARLLANISKQAGVEEIIGVEANARNRKRVLENLGNFLVDKNLETRRHAERLYQALKKHPFFNDYFFKEADSSMKVTLRRILNNIN